VTIVETSNEYPVLAGISDHLNNFRGGLRIEYDHWHVTVEQGGLLFQGVQTNTNVSNPNFGNLNSVFLGQRLFLSTGPQSYRTHTDSTYTQGFITATPLAWLDITGQFMFSEPKTITSFGEANTGNIFDRETFQFFARQTSRVFSQALQTHTSALLTAEVRPVGWLRILESWTTDRLHTAGSATTTQQFTTAATSPIVSMDEGPIATNYSREEINLLVDPIPSLTIRGGYRYEWGDVLAPLAFIGQKALSGPFKTAGLNRNTALAGVSYRCKQKLMTSADVEGVPGNHTYFRTSLYNYSFARVRARYQALPTLQLNLTFYGLTNSNPHPLIDYHLTSLQTSAGVNWLPNGGERLSIFAEYTQGTIDSHLFYVIPSTLERATSIYRDNTLLSALRPIPGRLKRARCSVRRVALVRYDSAGVFDPRVPLQSNGFRPPGLKLAWRNRTRL
jgi:hypothetical protein